MNQYHFHLAQTIDRFAEYKNKILTDLIGKGRQNWNCSVAFVQINIKHYTQQPQRFSSLCSNFWSEHGAARYSKIILYESGWSILKYHTRAADKLIFVDEDVDFWVLGLMFDQN